MKHNKFTYLLAMTFLSAACANANLDEPEHDWDLSREYDPTPRLVAPSKVSFSYVSPPNTAHRVIALKNEGHARLDISKIRVRSAPTLSELQLSFPSPDAPQDPGMDHPIETTTVEPGEEQLLRISFTPETITPSTANIIVYTNTPGAPQTIIPVINHGSTPCPALEGDVVPIHEKQVVDWGSSILGATRSKLIELAPCRLHPSLAITDVRILQNEDQAFSLKNALSLPHRLGSTPARHLKLYVEHTPSGVQLHEAILEITTNDPQAPKIHIQLRAESRVVCPVAIAEARLPGTSQSPVSTLTAILYDTVILEGERSHNPVGTINHHEWSVVKRPDGALVKLTPDNNTPSPRLFLDTPGEYILELMVWDEWGTPACSPSRVHIQVLPGQGIRVELTWVTPGNPIPNTGNSADLDLHYRHPMGSWNNLPHDIFWGNHTADWGVQGHVGDDPKLTLHDSEGRGSEIIEHRAPEQGLIYDIGVHYYEARSSEASHATIKIYADGVLTHEQRDITLPLAGTFWRVAQVEGGTNRIIPLGDVIQGFPRTTP